MAARRWAKQIRQVATINFLDLPPEIQTDVAVCMKARLERIHNIGEEGAGAPFTDDVHDLLTSLNPKIPLFLADTALLTRAPRELYEDKILEYWAVWETGEARFPPVVIDSESDEILCEGGHRAFSAREAGVKEIEAVDVSALDAGLIYKSLPKVYTISMSPEADRDYAKLQKSIRQKIDELIDRLRDWPQVSGVVALWGPAKGHYRVKTMDWRVIFHVDESSRTVVIDKIANRKEAYGEYH